jgi:cell division protein FtsL
MGPQGPFLHLFINFFLYMKTLAIVLLVLIVITAIKITIFIHLTKNK